MAKRLLLALLLASPLPTSCATIAGTAASPLTGAIDLAVDSRDNLLLVLPAFLGGMASGPFVALYNGLAHDASVFRDFGAYWDEFPDVFRPMQMFQAELEERR